MAHGMMVTITNPDYTIETIETVEGFKEIQNDWERLVNLKKGITPFFRFEIFLMYYKIILKNFTNIKINIFIVKNKNKKIIAIFPFTVEPKIFSSLLSFKELSIKDDYLIGFYHFLIDPEENQEVVFQKFSEYLKKRKKRWDIIRVLSLPQDEQLSKVFISIMSKSYKIDVDETNTLIIDCEREFDEYTKNDIDAKDFKFLKKKRRQLNRVGIIKFVEITEPYDIEKGLRTFYDIEDSGWKGREGTSLKRSYYGEFYKELAFHLSKENKFRLYFLQLNNDYIAGMYVIIDQGICYTIKIGYLEKFAKYSPSVMLDYFIFEHLFKEKEIRKIDFYGPFYSFQKIWGKHRRKNYNITICNKKSIPIIYYIFLTALKRLNYPFPENSIKGKIFTV